LKKKIDRREEKGGGIDHEKQENLKEIYISPSSPYHILFLWIFKGFLVKCQNGKIKIGGRVGVGVLYLSPP
jgi:hypothetical protein